VARSFRSASVELRRSPSNRSGAPRKGSHRQQFICLGDERGCAIVGDGGEAIVRAIGRWSQEIVDSHARRRRGVQGVKIEQSITGKRHEGFDCDPRRTGRCPGMRSRRWSDGAPIPSWVKDSCCSPADARHLTPAQVHRYADYDRVDGYRRPIPIGRALPSQDGESSIFYRNKNGAPGLNGGSGGQSGVSCFFVPMAF
jgi:hypothetical protein